MTASMRSLFPTCAVRPPIRRIGLDLAPRMRTRRTVVLAAASLALHVPASDGLAAERNGQPASAPRIVDIQIDPREVFDPENPSESHRVFAWANALHVRTREHVVKRELLFGVGDPFDPQRAAETERNLRALGVFQDAVVHVDSAADGVRIRVETSDRWTTELRTEISRRGGINHLTLGLEEGNLVGTAIRIGGAVQTSDDVDATTFSWSDPRLLGSRWAALYGLRYDDLGRAHVGALQRGFYSETVPWTASADLDLNRGQRRLFEAGEETERLEILEDRAEGYAAMHRRRPRLERWALLGGRRHVRGDVQDDIAFVGLAWSRLERTFRTVRDVDRFGVAEDVARGWTVQVGAGADLRALGASHDRLFARGDLGWACFLGTHGLCGLQLRQHTFWRDGRLEDGRLSAESFGYWQTPGSHTLAWRAGGAALLSEPRYLRFDLGGDDHLRGYEARHLTGTRILYAGLEERLFTNLRLFVLRLGGVVFVDAAAAWDAGEELDRSDARLGAGFGIRIGNSRSGSGTTGIDVAFGSRSVQVSVTSGSFFRVARGLSFPEPALFR